MDINKSEPWGDEYKLKQKNEMESLLQAGSTQHVKECNQPKREEAKHFNKEA
jgi:hypothetical protein